MLVAIPRTLLIPVAALLLASVQPSAPARLPLDQLKLPPGFAIDVYATGVTNARQMALGDNGTVFVGSRTAGNVYALVDTTKNHKADRVITLAKGLNQPSGIAFRDGALYVAEISRVRRYDGIENKLESPPEPVVITDKLPQDRHHGWKFIAFGPDGLLYVPVGAPCNICERDDAVYASITRMKPDGTGFEVFANGVRNSVGFDWHPQTRELWFTDNGRDSMGDDVPADELNRAARSGQHFGFPYCHAGDVSDPQFGAKKPCNEFEAPIRKLGPHVAAIGMRFYTGQMFPPEYRNQLLIAEHGSWNRSKPLGYRVMVVKLEGDKPISYEPLVEGWLRGIRQAKGEMAIGDAWGRPADVLVMPDGALLVSDDEGGVVYRVSYQKP